MDAVSPIEETYEEVRDLIYYMVHLFRRKHGGDFHELVAEANFCFTKVYENFEYGHGNTFGSYLSLCIYRHLLRCKRQGQMRSHLWAVSLDHLYNEEGLARPAADIVVDDVVDTSELVRQLEELSDDASIVIDLIVASPREFVEMVGGLERMAICRSWKGTLKRYLRGIGWTNRRVAESFEELGAVFS